MPDTPPCARAGSRAIPDSDLVLPVLDLAGCARRVRLPAPDVVGAGDLLARPRPRPAPRPDRDAPAASPAPALPSPWSAALARLRPAANDNRVRIVVLSALLALLMTHIVLDRVAQRAERVIEVTPPTQPGRQITSL